MKETLALATEVRVATEPDGSRIVSGLIPYNSSSVDLGGFTERIAPGAFSRALAPGADVYAFRQHNSDIILGRTKSGTLTLNDTNEGLRYSIKLPNTQHGNDLAELVQRGDLDGCSFGFTKPGKADQKWEDTPTGVLRTLLNVNMYEISPCIIPAYPDSRVSVRSCPPELRAKLNISDDLEVEDEVLESGAHTASEETPVESDDSELRNYLHMKLAIRKLK